MKLAVMFAALAVNVASGAVVDFPGVPWSDLHVDVASGHAEVLDKSGRKVLSFLPSPRTVSLDGLVLRLERDHLAIDLRAPASRGLKALVMRGHSAEGRDALSVGKPCTHLAEWEGSTGAVIDMYLEGEDAATGKHFFSCRPCGMGGRRRILSQLTCTPEKFGWFAFRYDIVKFGNGLFRYYGARAAPQGELDPDRPALPKHPPELIFHADFDGSASAKSSRGNPNPVVARGLSYAPGRRGRAVRMDAGHKSALAYRTEGNFDVRQGTVSLWVKLEWPDYENAENWRSMIAFPNSGETTGNGQIWFWWYGRMLRFDAADDARHREWTVPEIDGTWRHLAAAWNDERFKVWLDGACIVDSAQAEANSSRGPMFAALRHDTFNFFTYDRVPADVFNVGCRNARGGQIDGLIDELKVWDAPLSDDDVRAIYEADRPPAAEKPRIDYGAQFAKDGPNPHVGGGKLELEFVDEYRFDAKSMARYRREKRFRSSGDVVEKSLDGVPYLEAGTNQNDRFAFMFDIDPSVPLYCFDFIYPDDAKRTCDLLVQFKHAKGDDYALEVGYFTGDEYPNTGKMLTHRCLYWTTPGKGELAVVAMTARAGVPAALAGLRVHRVKDARLPPLAVREPKPVNGWNRMFGMYWEDPAIGYDFGTGGHDLRAISALIDRTAAYMKYCGQNVFCYPGVWYNGRIGEGYYNPRNHAPDFLNAWYVKFDKEGLFFVPNVNPNNLELPPGTVTTGTMADGSLHDSPIAIHDTGRPNWGGWHNSPPNFNFFHPDVQAQIERHIDALLDQGVTHPSFKGVCMHLTMHCMCWFGDIRSGYNDYAVRAFAKDRGLDIPIDEKDPKRGRTSAKWILANAREAWVQWRCDQVTRFYARMAAKLRTRRPDLKLWLNSFVQPDWNWPDFMEDGFMERQAREGGLDRAALAAIPNLILCQTQLPAFCRKRDRNLFPNDETYAFNRVLQTKPGFFALVKDARFPWINQHDLYWENPVGKEKGALNGDGFAETPWRVTTINPSGYHALRDFVLPLRFGDVLGMSKGGYLVGTYGMEEHLRKFAAAFRALPAVVFKDVADDLPADVRFRTAVFEGKRYAYVVNTSCERRTVRVRLAEGAEDLVTGQKLGGDCELTLDAYELRSFASSGK